MSKRWTSFLLALILLLSPFLVQAQKSSEKNLPESGQNTNEDESQKEGYQTGSPSIPAMPDPTNLDGLGNRRSIVVNGKYYEMDEGGKITLNTYLNSSVKEIQEKKEHPDYGQLALKLVSPDITVLPILGKEGNIDENRLYALDVYRSVGTDLKTLYDWTASQIDYLKEETYWALSDYGRQGFLEKKGNCLTYSAVFYYLASGLGYDARVVRGHVMSESGDEHEHAWVLINERGKDYLYDPQGERELGTGKDFYHIELDQAPLHYVYPEGEEPLQNRILG